jgi:hypothetical protein
MKKFCLLICFGLLSLAASLSATAQTLVAQSNGWVGSGCYWESSYYNQGNQVKNLKCNGVTVAETQTNRYFYCTIRAFAGYTLMPSSTSAPVSCSNYKLYKQPSVPATCLNAMVIGTYPQVTPGNASANGTFCYNRGCSLSITQVSGGYRMACI